MILETPVGRLAADHPAATRVFARYGLDYCCGGGKTLREACAEGGLDGERILEEIQSEMRGRAGEDRRWDDASSEELVAHIVTAFHGPLREELPRLESMSRKVASVHGHLHPTLTALSTAVSALRTELERHMEEEERIVFPGILQGQGAIEDTAEHIPELEHDHREAGVALDNIRQLTEDYELPAEACGTWQALWHGLEDLEKTMHEHVHLENNILFPRVSAG
jgi:regulator of cell morphogenesis and NO signaling